MTIGEAIQTITYLLSPCQSQGAKEAWGMVKAAAENQIIGKKHCYRYNQTMIEQCEVCEQCLQPEDLALDDAKEKE